MKERLPSSFKGIFESKSKTLKPAKPISDPNLRSLLQMSWISVYRASDRTKLCFVANIEF